MEAVLCHNFLRDGHLETPLVAWDKGIAIKAQLWAEELIKMGELMHSPPNSEFRDGDNGENIFQGSGMNKEGKAINACKNW